MLARQDTHASLKPTNLRHSVWKELDIKIMKTTLQGKETIHWTTTISRTNLFLCLKQWNHWCESSSGQRMGKTRENTSMAADESQNEKEVIDEARKGGKTVHFASLMDTCYLKNSELEPTFHKDKGRVVLRGDIVKDDSGSLAVFTEQRFICATNDCRKGNGHKIKASRMRRTSSRRSISLHPCQNGGRSRIVETSEIGMPRHFGDVYHDTSGPNLGPTSKTQSFPLERNLYGHPSSCQIVGRTICKRSVGTRMGESIESKVCSWQFAWMTSNLLEWSKISISCGRNRWNTFIWRSLRRLLITCTWDALNANVNQTRVWLKNTGKCSNRESLTEQLKSYLVGKISHENSRLVFWYGRTCKEKRGKIFRIGEKKSDFIRSQRHVLTTISSERKNWKRWETYQEFALTSSWSAFLWHELVGLTFFGP